MSIQCNKQVASARLICLTELRRSDQLVGKGIEKIYQLLRSGLFSVTDPGLLRYNSFEDQNQKELSQPES